MDPPPPAPPPRSPLRPPPPSGPEPTSENVLSKRQHALLELLSSERAYASDLTLILEVHIPLAEGPMTAEDIKIIFGNIAEIADLSDAFCEALEKTMGSALDDADATDDQIGALFLRYAPEIEGPYKQYITRHPSALTHLTALPSTPELTAYHAKSRELASSLSHAWDLSSLLIKPIQRLLKYSLLLSAIIDATASTHPDRLNLVSARTAIEEVARAVNEGRRRVEVVKEVLSAPKKPPTVLRIKSFRAPADVNSEAARVDRMAAELARIDVFAQQVSRAAQEWARAADTAAHVLLAWARAFAAAIGLSSTVRSEAFDAFLSTLTEALLPRTATLLPQIASDLLAPLARLLATAAQPRQLLASMAEHAPLHHHLLTMPVSPKNRPPQALMDASARYLALRTQLAAELPAYLSLLHRGLAALVRRLAAVQATYFGDARDAWAGLWDMLRVEGERNGGGAETIAVWRARWSDVDQGIQTLRICQPLHASLPQTMTPAEAYARANTNADSIDTNIGYSSTEPGNIGELGSMGASPASPHYERKSSSSASVHSGSSGKVTHVSNVLTALEPARPVNVVTTKAMLSALQPAHGQGMSPPPQQHVQVSGPYPLAPAYGRARGGSDAANGGWGGFPGWNSNRGKSPARNGNGNDKANPLPKRGKSPTPTTQTSKTARDGGEEFGDVVTVLGWGDYGGMIPPPKKVKDPERELEKAREKERERLRKLEREEAKEREKARKREEKKKNAATPAEPSPRSSLASSRIALLESAGYGYPKSSNKPKSDAERGKGVARRASDITNGTDNSKSSTTKSRPASRGRSHSEDRVLAVSPRAVRSRPPSPSAAEAEDFKTRRSTWLAAPIQYSCCVVHPCTPPAAVSYFGFPFFALEEHALLGVLHEAGHPSTHPRLPLYVDDGEDCLLLCRDDADEIGWALASFLAPLAID